MTEHEYQRLVRHRAAPSTTVAASEVTSTTESPGTTIAETTTTASTIPPTTTSSTTTSSTTTTTTTTIPPLDLALSGSGDDVIDLTIPGDEPAILTISHTGGSNFAVISHDSAGEYLDLLVNEIGRYEGRRPINFSVGENVAFLEITASGSWTVEATYLSDPDNHTDGNAISGSGDDVVVSTDLAAASGASRLAITHDGTSNFAIWAWGAGRDLLVNEIGNYDGTVLLGSGLFILDITADGNWTIDLNG